MLHLLGSGWRWRSLASPRAFGEGPGVVASFQEWGVLVLFQATGPASFGFLGLFFQLLLCFQRALVFVQFGGVPGGVLWCHLHRCRAEPLLLADSVMAKS